MRNIYEHKFQFEKFKSAHIIFLTQDQNSFEIYTAKHTLHVRHIASNEALFDVLHVRTHNFYSKPKKVRHRKITRRYIKLHHISEFLHKFFILSTTKIKQAISLFSFVRCKVHIFLFLSAQNSNTSIYLSKNLSRHHT